MTFHADCPQIQFDKSTLSLFLKRNADQYKQIHLFGYTAQTVLNNLGFQYESISNKNRTWSLYLKRGIPASISSMLYSSNGKWSCEKLSIDPRLF